MSSWNWDSGSRRPGGNLPSLEPVVWSSRCAMHDDLARSRPRPFKVVPGALRAVLHVGVGTIAAGGGLGVPLVLCILVFDHLAVAWHALLVGRGLGSRQRFRMRREGLREHAVNLVGPAAVVLDDFIRHMRH